MSILSNIIIKHLVQYSSIENLIAWNVMQNVLTNKMTAILTQYTLQK